MRANTRSIRCVVLLEMAWVSVAVASARPAVCSLADDGKARVASSQARQP